jgi:hypothetical protein
MSGAPAAAAAPRPPRPIRPRPGRAPRTGLDASGCNAAPLHAMCTGCLLTAGGRLSRASRGSGGAAGRGRRERTLAGGRAAAAPPRRASFEAPAPPARPSNRGVLSDAPPVTSVSHRRAPVASPGIARPRQRARATAEAPPNGTMSDAGAASDEHAGGGKHNRERWARGLIWGAARRPGGPKGGAVAPGAAAAGVPAAAGRRWGPLRRVPAGAAPPRVRARTRARRAGGLPAPAGGARRPLRPCPAPRPPAEHRRSPRRASRAWPARRRGGATAGCRWRARQTLLADGPPPPPLPPPPPAPRAATASRCLPPRSPCTSTLPSQRWGLGACRLGPPSAACSLSSAGGRCGRSSAPVRPTPRAPPRARPLTPLPSLEPPEPPPPSGCCASTRKCSCLRWAQRCRRWCRWRRSSKRRASRLRRVSGGEEGMVVGGVQGRLSAAGGCGCGEQPRAVRAAAPPPTCPRINDNPSALASTTTPPPPHHQPPLPQASRRTLKASRTARATPPAAPRAPRSNPR